MSINLPSKGFIFWPGRWIPSISLAWFDKKR